MTDHKKTESSCERQRRAFMERWLGRANVEKKALLVLADEADSAMELVEFSVSNLSKRFLELVALSQQQSKRITDFSENISHVEFQGKNTPLSDIFQTFDHDLTGSLGKILNLAKKSVALSYHLDDMDDVLENLSRKIDRGEPVTQKDLEAISKDIKVAKENIGEIATVDLQDKIDVKERLSELLANVIAQSQRMEEALVKSSEDAQKMSNHIAEIITQMQFQDRTSQRLQQIGSTLHVIADLLDSYGDEASKIDSVDYRDYFDDVWFEKLTAEIRLEEMRKNFADRVDKQVGNELQEMDNPDTIPHSNASDDIELF